MEVNSHRSPTSAEAHASKSTPPTSADVSSHSSSAFASALRVDALALKGRLHGVSLHVARGETLALLGPSGAGKTSLLRCIAGLETQTGGSVWIDARCVDAVPPERRRVGLVFQEDTLFPHLTVAANLAFGMRDRTRDRLRSVAQALEIEHLLNERPRAISGGERQRAALARAVLAEARVLLLDEPLAHLDPQLRVRVRRQISAFVREWGGPVIFVTHDHEEALAVGDRIALLMDGRIAQCDRARDVYDRPATLAAARFFGSPSMNVLEGPMYATAVRAEHVRLDSSASLRGRVVAVEDGGADAFVRVATESGEIVARVRVCADVPRTGEQVGLSFDDSHALRYDTKTGLLI